MVDKESCIHETACWLSPDFSPMRYRCNQCGKETETLLELAQDGERKISRNLQWKLAQRVLAGQV